MCALAVVLASSVGAYAQEAEPSAETNEAEARGLFEAGRSAYSAGRYEAALDYFQRAYALSERPAFLFNMGSAAERLRLDDEALDAYRRYLEAAPEAGNREFVQSRIAFLESHRRPEEPEPEATPVVAPEPEPEPPPSGGDVTGEWWFWTLIAVLVVGAAVGVSVGVALATATDEPPLQGNFGETGVTMTLVEF